MRWLSSSIKIQIYWAQLPSNLTVITDCINRTTFRSLLRKFLNHTNSNQLLCTANPIRLPKHHPKIVLFPYKSGACNGIKITTETLWNSKPANLKSTSLHLTASTLVLFLAHPVIKILTSSITSFRAHSSTAKLLNFQPGNRIWCTSILRPRPSLASILCFSACYVRDEGESVQNVLLW